MSKLKPILPIMLMLVVIFCFYFTKITVLKFYPVAINFFFFACFLLSNFKKKPVIQIIAEKLDGELPLKLVLYTKKLNWIWTVVTGINFILSVVTLYVNNTFWALYNGCVSYFLVGITFLVEYPIRIWYKRRLKLEK